MDFGSVLHVAQKNEQIPKKEIKYYSTKFEPPKKEERSKQLSVNIKKFLARKEAEEKQKQQEAKLKREELLSLRSQDKKAQRRVSVMLKRTKSANKSVIQDAIDNDNTAVTLAGPSQPDEDDYGYVSQEASAFYNKMMAKYNNTPEEDKFAKAKKNVNVNLNGTKDRVRAALLREQEEALLPHKRKRKSKAEVEKEVEEEPDLRMEVKKEKSKPRPAAPPPINFSDLLKIAEKKQFEPILIEKKKEPTEEERPMTKKQKKDYEKEREWRERKEKGLTNVPPPNKIPKLTPKTKPSVEDKIKTGSKPQQPLVNPKKNDEKPTGLKPPYEKRSEPKPSLSKPSSASPIFNKSNTSKTVSKLNSALDKPRQDPKDPKLTKLPLKEANKPKQSPPTNLIPKQQPPTNLKPKQFPPNDLKPKSFPPKEVKRKLVVNKNRILDDDEDEYDSEMDDFIDDGPEEGENYSKYISEIFGYDKSKYKNEHMDDSKMESSFSQMMREEFVSSKIGLLEDLEDMKKEAEEKKRKAKMKKTMK